MTDPARSIQFLSWLGFSLVGTLQAAENPRLLFAHGVLAEHRGEKQVAAEHFEKAWRLDPSALSLARRVADHRQSQGDLAGATRAYREIASHRPGDLQAQLAYADFLLQAGSGDALARKLRIELLERQLAENPTEPSIIERLFQHHLESGDQSAAKALLGNLTPSSAMLHASLARSLADSSDPQMLEKIRSMFEAAVLESPENPSLARAASEHFRNIGRLEDAIAVLARHTKAAPWSLDLRARLGVLHFSAKQEEQGQIVLEELLKIDPAHALAHQSLAKSHRLRGNDNEARHHAGELLKIRGGSPREFMELAQEWLDADAPRPARLLLEKAVFDHPEHAELARSYAIACRRDPETRGQSARRFRDAELMSDGKSEPAFLLEAAEASLDEGDSKQAEAHLRNAIRAFPPEAKKESAAAMRRLAALWDEEGRNAGPAEALRQRARSLDPEP